MVSGIMILIAIGLFILLVLFTEKALWRFRNKDIKIFKQIFTEVKKTELLAKEIEEHLISVGRLLDEEYHNNFLIELKKMHEELSEMNNRYNKKITKMYYKI